MLLEGCLQFFRLLLYDLLGFAQLLTAAGKQLPLISGTSCLLGLRRLETQTEILKLHSLFDCDLLRMDVLQVCLQTERNGCKRAKVHEICWQQQVEGLTMRVPKYRDVVETCVEGDKPDLHVTYGVWYVWHSQ